MSNILTEQDTFFGSIAYRNKLITVEQLQEGVLAVQQSKSQLRLGDYFLQTGYMSEEEVNAILDMQNARRHILEEKQKKEEPIPTPPLPKPEVAKPVIDSSLFSLPGAPKPEPIAPIALSKSAPELVVLPKSFVPYSPTETAASKTVDLDAELPLIHAPFSPMSKPETPPPPPPKVEVIAPPVLEMPAKLESLKDYLTYARLAGASDLHISADVKPFMRLHGSIRPMEVPVLDARATERLLFSVLDNAQKGAILKNQGLELCIDIPGDGRYRACMFKQRCGWDGNFHIIRDRVPTFEELGLPECLRRLTEYNQGLVLVTGPSNSGKTTTLAALIDEVNRTREDHIITVEKPVEYVHTSQMCQVTQRNVGLHTKSFSAALRAALREDPDIIMVGELRDLDTLSIAITASETGHLVFGTLPTTSAVNTVSRVVDGFPVGQQAQIRMMMSESLRGVISQQLLPRKDGTGVALALEILFITPAVSALIRDNQPHQIYSVIQTSRKIGMCRLDDNLLELVQKEVISGAEAYRRATSKQVFEQYKNQI